MKYIVMLILCTSIGYAQFPLQRSLSLPRGDARTLQFTTDTDVQGDSIVFSVSLFYQETFSASSNVVLRKANNVAFDGDAEQVFVTDSTIGTVKVYISMTNSLALGERQYYYSLRVNDTTKFFGTINMVPTVFTTQTLTFLTTTSDVPFENITTGTNEYVLKTRNGVTQWLPDSTGTSTGITTEILTDSLDANTLRSNPVIIPFTPSASPAHTEGYVFYDEDNDALTVFNAESDVALQVGEEEWVFVRNASGATIENGKVVYVDEAVGQIPTVELAQANDTLTAELIGMATHDIENNTSGYVTRSGLVRGLNTSNYGDGASVYLSVDSAGHFTLNKPVFPNMVKRVGTVVFSHGSLGKVLVHITAEHDTTGQTNNERFTALEVDVSTNATNIADTASYNDRLNAIETDVTTNTTSIGDTASYNNRVDAIEADVTTNTTSIGDTASYNDRVNAIEADVTTNTTSIGDTASYNDRVNAIETDVTSNTTTANAALPLLDYTDSTGVISDGGARSFSSAGRIFVAEDSVVLDGASSLDASLGNIFRGTTASNTTLIITNMLDGQIVTLRVIQGASHTLVINGMMWANNGTAPVLTTGAESRDVFTIIKTGGTMIGMFAQNVKEP